MDKLILVNQNFNIESKDNNVNLVLDDGTKLILGTPKYGLSIMPSQQYLRLLIDGSSIAVCTSEYYAFNEEEVLSLLDDEYTLLELKSFFKLDKEDDEFDDEEDCEYYGFYDDEEEDYEEQKIETALYVANDDGVIYFSPSNSLKIEKCKVYKFDIINEIEYITFNGNRYPVPQQLKQYFDKLEIAN